MNRNEYLTRLAELLQDIPAEERVSAMEYYNNYFDDAGAENEQKVIEELGDPEQVVREVKAGLGKTEEEPAQEEDVKEHAAPDMDPQPQFESDRTYSYGDTCYSEPQKKERDWGKILLLGCLILFALPVAGPIVISIVGAAIGIVAAIFGIFIGLLLGAIGVTIAGGAVIVVSLLGFPIHLASGCVALGLGLILFSAGCAATVGMIKACMVVLPAVFRFVIELIRKVLCKVFHRREAMAR